MSEFRVVPALVKSQTEGLDKIANSLDRYSDNIASIKNNLTISGDAGITVRRQLQTIIASVQDISGACNRLSTGLTKSVRLYESAESKITGVSKVRWNDEASSGGTGTPQKKSNIMNLVGDGIYELAMAAAGPFGKVVDSLVNVAGGKPGNVYANYLEMAGDAVDSSNGSLVDWKEFLGFTDATKTPWKDAVGKYFDISSGGKAFSAVCRWGAAIVKSGFDNYNEHGSFSTRFWQETAVEAVATIGEGILITAGVGAAFTLLGLSPHVLVVGGAVAVATAAVDWAANSIFEKQGGWKEAASDVALNIGGAVADWAHDLGLNKLFITL